MKNAKTTRCKPPTYLCLKRKKGSDLAFVILGDRRIYLGPYKSPESIEKYKRVVAEFKVCQGNVGPAPTDVRVIEVLNRFRKYAENYYRGPSGTVGKEMENYLPALGIVCELCGRMPASEFSPRELKAVRQVMIERAGAAGTSTGRWCECGQFSNGRCRRGWSLRWCTRLFLRWTGFASGAVMR